METLVKNFIDIFGGLDKNVIIFLISMMPILELRGGLIAASLLKLNPVTSFIICIIGNMIPVPFIFLFARKILEWGKDKK